MNIINDEFELKLNDSQAARNEVFYTVLNFFVKHQSFNGESIVQNDIVQIEGPEFLAELAEIFEFEVKWKDEE